MEEVLRWSLLVVGGCIIAAVLAHGLWVSRKNSAKKRNQRNSPYGGSSEQEYQPGDWHDPDDETTKNIGDSELIDVAKDDEVYFRQEPVSNSATTSFDDLGLGAVKTVTGKDSEQKSDTQRSDDPKNTNDVDDIQAPTSEEVPAERVNMYKSVVTQPKPQFADVNKPVTTRPKTESNSQFLDNTDAKPGGDSETPMPPASLMRKQTEKNELESQDGNTKKADLRESSPVEKVSLADQARNLVKRKKMDSIANKRKEPKFAEDQMRIDFNEEQSGSDQQNQPKSPQTATAETEGDKKENAGELKQEVLVLNVKTVDDQPIPGSALLPMLLTLGFKFGDQDIFHRHVNSNGKGPVLFSLANMFKPGNFDIDNLENFVTQGVSLFMILPIEGDPHQVFNMMHNAARKIADEFSGQIYDGRRTLLTKQSLQQYVEKIREFERHRVANKK